MIHQILFFIFAAICVAGAVNLLLQKHPIHSALSLILVMGSLAVLYLLLGAPFLALIQIIVYAGAIMVLFVYVIMLLNAGEEEQSRGSRVAWLVGAPATALGAGILIWMLVRGTRVDIQIGEFVGDTTSVALLLFKEYLLPFEITSVLILIAIMGAVVLARREH
jgi:NADH-quinone oxidoreductase subunit J